MSLVKQKIALLAIESSCDDTSAAVWVEGRVKSNIVATQLLHKTYGGVVPELASRAHQRQIVMVLEEALQQAQVDKSELSAIAFTRGPGLLGSLLVGVSFSKGLALALRIPLIEVNHMEAHILAHFIEDPRPDFPFLCLTVSGGHTQIVRVDSQLKMKVLGETIDDAVGEAFDKAAKMLGLGYPGGPQIDAWASKGNCDAFDFPISEIAGLDFSFSGIKTALLYFIQKNGKEFVKDHIADICASYQKTLIETLLRKIRTAAQTEKIDRVAIAGGVSANTGLRKAIQQEAKNKNWEVFIPDFQYCTDNAAMIAQAAYYKFLEKDFSPQTVSPLSKMKI